MATDGIRTTVTRQGKRLFVWLLAFLLCALAVRLAVFGSLL